MRLSIFLMGTRNGSYSDIVDQVVEADELGFGGVWLAERHFASGDLLWPSPMVAASFLAAHTRRIRLGLAARVLPFHHPLHVGADAATLDVLSGGRVDLGLSRGSMDDLPHHAFAVPRPEAAARFDEALKILSLFLLGEPFSFKGRHFDLKEIVPSPASVQRPHPPVYLVANSPQALDAAADRGLPVFMNGALRPVDIEQAMTRYRERTRDVGFDAEAIDIPVNRFVFVGKDRRHARRLMRDPFIEFIERRAPDLRASLLRRFGRKGLSFEFLSTEIAIFDDPEGCAAKLADLEARSGVEHILCTFNLITLDHEEVLGSMRRFASLVVPLLGRVGMASAAPSSIPPESLVRLLGDPSRRIAPTASGRGW